MTDMRVMAGGLPGLVVLEPAVFGDPRGFLFESWNAARYRSTGLPERFVQDNVSFSTRGVLRGLHFQHPSAQGKLVTVLVGEVFDVAVDIRPGSPTFGKWAGRTLSAANHRQFYLPPGFAHGFVVTSPDALVLYKCTEYYRPEEEQTLLWNDPDLGIDWPEPEPELSDRDRRGRRLAELMAEGVLSVG